MYRLSLLIAMLTAIVTGMSARTLMPPQPEEYKPYMSELMLSRLSQDKNLASDEDAVIDLGMLTKYYRLTKNRKPMASSYCLYVVDTITPSLIDMRMSEGEESIKSTMPAEDLHRVQLGVLPGNRKRPVAVLVSTLYPGGIPDSEVRFLEFPPEKEMLNENNIMNRQLNTLEAAYNNFIVSSDSIKSLLHQYAAEANLLPEDTVVAIDDDFDIDFKKPKDIQISRFMKVPTISDFFNIPKGAAAAQVKEAIASIPFPMISYDVSPDDLSLTATLHYAPLVSMELAKELEPYHIKELKYIWDGKHYKLSPTKKMNRPLIAFGRIAEI